MNNQENTFDKTKRIGIGSSFIIFPLVFIYAFTIHPNLFNPKMLEPAELIQRAHYSNHLHFAHALVTLSTGLLVIASLHFMSLLKNTSGKWFGLIGSVLAILGSLMLAADKGALCLTMSALDTLPENEFINMMPGLLAIFNKQGWLVLIWGLILLPIGFIVQTMGLLKSKSFAKWQCILFIIAMLFIGTPDGLEIINLTASILMSIVLIPYGYKILIN